MLATAISERLAAVTPEEASSSIDTASIEWLLDALVDQPGEPEKNLVNAAERVLDHVQDEIIRDIAEGWPPSGKNTPGMPDGGEDLPLPGTEVAAGRLRLYYGDIQNPTLELPPIPLEAEPGLLGPKSS